MKKLIMDYENDPWGGLLVRRVENSYVMSTKPGMKKVLERMFSPKMQAAAVSGFIRDLAVIAYNQPVTRAPGRGGKRCIFRFNHIQTYRQRLDRGVR